ncbi:MAG: polysaccharide export protein [Pseudomonadales bacterium]|nr:polysaccharide export protein [Pseudomonadales bacterium]
MNNRLAKPFLLLLLLLCNTASFAQQPPNIPSLNQDDEYTLGASDVIEIVVFGEDDLSVERRVNSRGNISVPLLGAVKVQGKTVNEVAALLADMLKGDYLINPQLNVSVVEYRQFYVRGEVKSPGGFPYLPGLTIGKAVAIAGGFTERASRKKMEVSREQKEGGRETIILPITDTVAPGDIIIVEESFF